MGDDNKHLQCPYCTSYEVSRLFLASTAMDSCECQTCGARWEEEIGSGRFRGRSRPDSVLTPKNS